jgi:hypothetical protein
VRGSLRQSKALLLTLALSAPAEAKTPRLPDQGELEKLAARFSPTPLRVDLASLSPSERRALPELVRAAQVMDALFLRQVWAGNAIVLETLARDPGELGVARLHAFLQNAGPWLRLDADQPFLADVPPKPAQANFYPEGATRGEIETYFAKLSPADASTAKGFYSTLRRTPEGVIQVVPYSLAYQGLLGIAATHLRKAAAITQDRALGDFLTQRATAFSTNRYQDSDIAWMKLDGELEVTLGPYEVYEDGWFNLKAAFEAFIGVRDAADTQRLQQLAGQLQWLEDHLPVEPAYRNPKLGASAPIRVVNEIFCAGDANHGVQTAAYNLPNDEAITARMGTKRVMLKNVQQAKFDRVLLPIAAVALAHGDQRHVSFDAFFTHILMHELMHGLGPHQISADGKATTVRESLQSSYSTLEEAKADISGLWALQQLVDKGALPATLGESMYATFLASAFRSIRFGLNEAHGRGQALQLNSLLDAGAFRVGPDGRFSVNAAKAPTAVRDLAETILTIEAHGDKQAADQLLQRLGVIRPEVRRMLDRLAGVPIDIEPQFVTATELLR